MDLFTTARRLESKIAGTLDSAAQRALGSALRDPLAVIQAVVERVAAEVQPVGRGRRVFPYTAIAVTFRAESSAERARFDAVLDSAPALHDRIVDALRGQGVSTDRLDVRIAFAPAAQPGWTCADFDLELARGSRPVELIPPAPPPHPIELTVAEGVAEQPIYTLTLGRIDLGRGRDVRDIRSRLLRTNHVAFADDASPAVNTSVSRRHAHITWDAATREHRLFDDGSAHGTHVLRNGSAIVVRSGARGLRLRDGDEIVLGEAKLRVAYR